MPELPEVETTVRGIRPVLEGACIEAVVVRDARLRWPVTLPDDLCGQQVQQVTRRAKYLLLKLETGSLILHLGMSGRLCVVSNNVAPGTHDHLDFVLSGGRLLRYTDPRRFGSLHWHHGNPHDHWLLRDLGVEPLADAFDGEYLFRRSRGRRVAVKNFLMDAHVVVGVGNIYANEALFHAAIRPRIQVGRISRERFVRLTATVRDTLQKAIELGGTTLRDFVDSDGRPGYFEQQLFVYGRAGLPCRVCATPLKGLRVAQRATVYCPKCQR